MYLKAGLRKDTQRCLNEADPNQSDPEIQGWYFAGEPSVNPSMDRRTGPEITNALGLVILTLDSGLSNSCRDQATLNLAIISRIIASS